MAGMFLCVFTCRKVSQEHSLVDLLPSADLKEQREYPHSCHADYLVINI